MILVIISGMVSATWPLALFIHCQYDYHPGFGMLVCIHGPSWEFKTKISIFLGEKLNFFAFTFFKVSTHSYIFFFCPDFLSP